MLSKGVLSNYLNFLVKSPTDSNKARWEVVGWWKQFLEGFDKISLTTRNPENDLTKKKEWIYKYISKVDLMLFASELDNFELDSVSSKYLKEFLLKGFSDRLTDKDMEMINTTRINNNLSIISKRQLKDYLYSIKDIMLINEYKDSIK